MKIKYLTKCVPKLLTNSTYVKMFFSPVYLALSFDSLRLSLDALKKCLYNEV